MEYPNLIALIDARIALLQRARNILATSSSLAQPPSRRRTKRQRPPALSRRPKTTTSTVSPEAGPAPVPKTEPVRLAFVAPRERSSTTKKAVPAEKPSALAAHLPTGPVFVSAARVREEEARRREAESKPEPISEDKPAKVNQILRKWREEQTDSNPPGTVP